MAVSNENKGFNELWKLNCGTDKVIENYEVDEVSSDKNAPLSSGKGAKIDIKPVKGIISEVSNNNNNLVNKRKKEHIPATFDNFRKSRLTSEQIRNHKVSWLIDDFIISQSLGMIYAQAGSGKSYFSIF